MCVKYCPECGSKYIEQQFASQDSIIFFCLACAKRFKIIILEDLDKKEMKKV